VFEDKGDVISIKYNERVMSYISLVGDKYKIILYTYHLFLKNVKQKNKKNFYNTLLTDKCKMKEESVYRRRLI
jgi:hypothetical protein